MSDEPRGFIHTLQDVKTLILFVLSHLEHSVSMTTLYELCFQDDRLSYFDLALVLPQLIESGHVTQDPADEYAITDIGRADGKVLESDLPLSLRSRCQSAIQKYQSDLRRAETALCQIQQRDDGLYDVIMTQQSVMGQLLRLEVMAPNLNQARVIERAWNRQSERVLKAVMSVLTSGSDDSAI